MNIYVFLIMVYKCDLERQNVSNLFSICHVAHRTVLMKYFKDSKFFSVCFDFLNIHFCKNCREIKNYLYLIHRFPAALN